MLSKGTAIGDQQYTDSEMKALVDESHRRGIKVAAHAHGTQGIIAAIKAGVDSVEHASLIDDEGIRLAVEYGTTLVMDIFVSDYILQGGEAAGFLPESLEKERMAARLSEMVSGELTRRVPILRSGLMPGFSLMAKMLSSSLIWSSIGMTRA